MSRCSILLFASILVHMVTSTAAAYIASPWSRSITTSNTPTTTIPSTFMSASSQRHNRSFQTFILHDNKLHTKDVEDSQSKPTTTPDIDDNTNTKDDETVSSSSEPIETLFGLEKEQEFDAVNSGVPAFTGAIIIFVQLYVMAVIILPSDFSPTLPSFF